ncbi:MAG: hypothetical protein ACE5JC_09940 [Candidatus Zixiibacteriota bacterium]
MRLYLDSVGEAFYQLLLALVDVLHDGALLEVDDLHEGVEAIGWG